MTVALCGGKTSSGGKCRRPAGWGTDHVGEGRCKLHGGRNPIKHGRYSVVKRPRIKELFEHFARDAEPLDLSPEVHMLRALVLDFIERYDEYTEASIAWHASFGPAFLQHHEEWQGAFRQWLTTWEDFQGAFTAFREKAEQVQGYYRLGWPEPPALPALIDPPLPPDPAQAPGKPRQVVDILSAGRFLSEIGAMVDRIHKQKQEGMISLATLNRIMERFGVDLAQAAQEAVEDESARTRLLENVERRWNSISIDGLQNSSSSTSSSTGAG